MSVDQSGTSLSVRDYLSVLRRRRRLLTIFVLVGVLLGLGYAAVAPRKWTSTAQVVVRPVNQSLTEASSVAPDKLLTMSTEQQVASSGDIALDARRILHSSDTADELLRRLSVSNPAGTVVLVFDYTDSSPKAARAGAEAFARAYLNQRRDRYAQQVRHETDLIDRQLAALDGKSGNSGQRAALTQQRSALLTLDTTPGSFNQNASLPLAPSSPNGKLALAVGAFLGLFLGILAAFARDAADPRLRDGAELADRLGRPTLTELPALWRGGARTRSGLILTDAPKSRQAAALRLLRSRLMIAGLGTSHRVLLVTSPRRTAGKSLVAANVAAGLAEAGKSVLLVTADAQAPSHDRLFGITSRATVGDALAGAGDPDTLAEEVRVPQWDGAGSLRVLPAAGGGGAALSASRALGRLFTPSRPRSAAAGRSAFSVASTVEGGAEVVVIDCPPLLEEADALTAVQYADVVVLVAGPGTRRADLATVDELVTEAGVPVLGSVFDRSRGRQDGTVEAAAPEPVMRSVPVARPDQRRTSAAARSARSVTRRQVGARGR